ncbi:MAG: DUF427 domain-containing protein [Mycobacteriaceae bacterium]
MTERTRESVWDYPRPPRLEVVERHVVVRHAGTTVVDTTDVVRVLETSHPPTYYLPRTAFADGVLHPVARRTMCEWKGTARYVDLYVPGAAPLAEIGWWYPKPDRRYPQLTDRVALYAGPLDEVLLDGEQVTPQPGGFYGGWVTQELDGPFKGEPGTWGW